MATHGRVDSYDNTVPQKRMVTDRIINTSPFNRMTVEALGLDNYAKFKFVNKPFRTYEWLEDQYVGYSDTLTASGGMASDSTTTTCLVTTPKMYNVGDVIKIDSELMWVSAVNTSTAQLTVVRNYGGTQATHANSSTVLIVAPARLEGADADNSPATEVTSTTNCSQIFQRTVEVSRTEQLIPLYGISELMGYQIDMRMDEMIMALNRVPYYGVRNAGSSSHTSGRSAGGFTTFITTNVTAAGSVPLTRNHIDSLLEDIYGYGGAPNLLFTTAFQQRKINSLYESFVQTDRTETIGGIQISTLEPPISGMVPLKIIVDRHCPAGYVWLIDGRYCGYITIDPFFYETLAKAGDADKGEVVGEYGFVVAYEKAHAYISGLTTS